MSMTPNQLLLDELTNSTQVARAMVDRRRQEMKALKVALKQTENPITREQIRSELDAAEVTHRAAIELAIRAGIWERGARNGVWSEKVAKKRGGYA